MRTVWKNTKNGFCRRLYLACLCLVFLPGITGADTGITELSTSGLLRKAAELSKKSGTLNSGLLRELNRSRELSVRLRQELTGALSELDALKGELETQRILARSSSEELNEVSALLRNAENGLKNLERLYTNSIEELRAERGRANRAERSTRIWRSAAIIIGALGLGAAAGIILFY